MLSSCVKITHSDDMTYKSKIFDKSYIPEKTEWKYHYGYSLMKGKICWHYGQVTTNEKYYVKFKFLDKVLERDDQGLYNRDSITIIYYKVYHDSVFYNNKIVKIE